MKTHRRRLALLFIVGLIAAPAQARQDYTPIDKNEIDALVQRYHDARLFNGSILVAHGDNVVYKNGFGNAHHDFDIPNSPDTRFRIGSITKQFTAAIILQLAEEGKLDLQGNVTDYVPDYPAETGDQITIHQLLNHTSGIPNYTAIPGWFEESSRDTYTPDEFLSQFSELELDFEPGSEWNYSNSGFFLLGVIIEHVTGMDFDDALEARITAPLGLENTGYDDFDRIITQRAQGYQKTPLGYAPAAYLDTTVPYAAGMIYSTVGDLHKWTRALHSGEVFTNSESYTLMTTPYMNDYGYGIGISSDSLGGKLVREISHGGGINGFSAMLQYFPDEEYTLVSLDNSALPARALGAVRDLVYGETPEEPTPAITDVIGPIVVERGVYPAIERYRELKRTSPDDYDFGEGQLNVLGYYFLQNGDVEVAVELFKLNVEQFPEAANPYDSLGEAYLEAGNEELAIKNYGKSLELNPGNETARQVLNDHGVQVEDATFSMTPDQLEEYVGKYELAPGFILSVTREGDQLFSQATNQPKVEVFATAIDEFFLKVVDAQLSFNRNDDGAVESMTLHQGGQHVPGKKIE